LLENTNQNLQSVQYASAVRQTFLVHQMSHVF